VLRILNRPLYFMLRMCSLYLILSVLPVCPMYTFLHSAHASLYIPVCSYLLVIILSLSILSILKKSFKYNYFITLDGVVRLFKMRFCVYCMCWVCILWYTSREYPFTRLKARSAITDTLSLLLGLYKEGLNLLMKTVLSINSSMSCTNG
jgi:hypothetical protein